MQHDESVKIPANLKQARNPKYSINEQVISHADHMEGMNGAKATVVDVFDTIAYAISYTPTNGDQPVENHKWIVQEELKEANEGAFKAGDKVTLETDHMPGMKGATAKIDQSANTNVYMIDYVPTNEDKTVYNHKWVIEEELTKEE